MPFWLWLWMGLFGVLSLTCCHLLEERRSATERFAWKLYFAIKGVAPFHPRWRHRNVWLDSGRSRFSDLSVPENVLQPASIPLPQGNGRCWSGQYDVWENSKEIHLRVLRAKRSAIGNTMGCFNTYSFGDQSSFDMFPYSLGRLGLLI